MVIAWYLLGFFGLLVARYAKDIDKDFCVSDGDYDFFLYYKKQV